MDSPLWTQMLGYAEDETEPHVSAWERLVPGQHLPPLSRRKGFSLLLILQEVGTLPADDQLRLLDWLQRTAGRIQIVSTSSTALLPRVQSGTFIDMRYYRLSMVCIDMTA